MKPAKVPKGVSRIYEAASTYAVNNNLNPHALSIDYGRLAQLAGFADKSNARRAVLQAEEAMILYRLDPGMPSQPGCKGMPTLFCLRGEGETLEQAIEDGKFSKNYQARLKKQPEGKRKPALLLVHLRWEELKQSHPEVYWDVVEVLKNSFWLPEQQKAEVRFLLGLGQPPNEPATALELL